MRWKGRRQSTNVEDRRHQRGGGFGTRLGGGGIKIGGGVGFLIIIVVLLLLGGNPQALLQNLPAQTTGAGTATAPTDQQEELQVAFVKTVLADTEDVWNDLFARKGSRYREPSLVLFRDRVESACGIAGAATGPFYCPGDEQIYIDLSFFDELARRFKAPGDFAQAYVIAHEVGHHIQRLTGVTDQVHSLRGRISQEEYNELSVRLELQADFYAGVWAHHAQRTKDILERGDIEEALRAASAIGDDAIQRRMQGYVVPESFTHGTSEQRVKWFRLGLETGDLNRGDTFNSPDP